MNKKHVNGQIASIRHWLGHKNVRLRQTMLASIRQMELVHRINKVRQKIDLISSFSNIYVYVGGDWKAVKYLMDWTNICPENILGIVGDSSVQFLIDMPREIGLYHILSEENADFLKADCVVIATLLQRETIIESIRSSGYDKTIVDLYDTDDCIPFYHVPAISDKSLDNGSGGVQMSYEADPYYFSIIKRIDKINKKLAECKNKKVLVYCVGGHTDALFSYTDIQSFNVVGFVDRGCRYYRNQKVMTPEKESFQGVDCVVVSSFRYQDEIVNYLMSLNIDAQIITLYDAEDVAEFYENPNIYAPDFPYVDEIYRKYDINEVYALAEKYMQKLNGGSDCYVTYSITQNEPNAYYPGEPEVVSAKNYSDANRETAIIIQGPVIYDDDFTYRTVRLYKLLFPGAMVILSTWDTEANKPEFLPFKTLGIEIVLSKVPDHKGILNLNYQVLSTYNGLKRAKEKGCVYALKTRTDFRIHAEECLSHFKHLTKSFPLKNTTFQRVTVLPPILDVPYYIPDFLMFGQVNDLMTFWDAGELYPDRSCDHNPEMLLFMRYFKCIGKYIDDPIEHLEEYIKVLSDNFIVVNASAYRYIWKKYTYESSMMYEEKKNTFNFVDWFNHQHF